MVGLILAFPHEFQSFVLVAFGATLGANTRYIIYQRLEKVSKSKHFRISIINNFSSFLLGLFYALSTGNDSHKLSLIFLVGFLGSMSTFSTFIYDLFEIYFEFKIFKIVNIFFISITLSLLSLIIGYLIGNMQ